MTIEQKAEKYADSKVPNKKGYLARWNLVKEAYIASAKENGIQWHDLRKDPNDLPKENNLYLVFGYTNKREKFYELDVFEKKEF